VTFVIESSLGLLHLGLIDRPSVPHIHIVPSVFSRGAPHHAAREASFSEGRKLHTRILPSARNELQLMGSFTCPKFGTWDRLFDFPSEGRHAEDFFRRTREPEASMLTTRPPKPLSCSITWRVIFVPPRLSLTRREPCYSYFRSSCISSKFLSSFSTFGFPRLFSYSCQYQISLKSFSNGRSVGTCRQTDGRTSRSERPLSAYMLLRLKSCL
jgi:hypothetical protein